MVCSGEERRARNRWGKTALLIGAVEAGAWLSARAWRQFYKYDFAGQVALVAGGSRGLRLVPAQLLTVWIIRRPTPRCVWASRTNSA
jgi:hypothetical protein